MNVVTKEFDFCAAHRIEGHPKCGRMHGHNYRVIISVRTEFLDVNGMVLDFGDLSKAMKPLIDQMDHRYLVSQANISTHDEYAQIAQRKGDAFMLNIPNSTAEQLSELIHLWAWSALELDPKFVSVTVEEKPGNVASYYLEG